MFPAGQRSAFRLSMHAVRTGSSHRSTVAVWMVALQKSLHCLCVFHMPASRTHLSSPSPAPSPLSLQFSVAITSRQKQTEQEEWDFFKNNPVVWEGVVE